jgi:two-component system, cell cycle response regulator DivK
VKAVREMAQKKPGDGPKKSARRSPPPSRRERGPGDGSAAQGSDGGSQEGSGALVLVVDDYQDAREMCCEYLTYCGFRVAEARNGQEAIDKAAALLPDLILMDLSLPGMDGWEATRRLKADDKTKRIPVVALTGHALAGHSEGAKAAGCDAFITKPCMPDALVAEVKRMLEGPKKPRSKSGS